MQTDRTCYDLFDTWTEQSAYILGLWWADGYIHLHKDKHHKQGYYKEFSVANTDHQIMLLLGSILKRAVVPMHKSKPNWQQCYQIIVRSEKLFDFCYNLVGTTHKSNTPLIMPNIPPEFLCHFIRGYFDGDGSIHWTHYNNRHGNLTKELRSSFTAGNDTGTFLEQLSRLLNTLIGTKHKNITSGNNRKLIFGQYDSMKLCNWMYGNATIYMVRKKLIWDSADKTRLTNSIKYHSKIVQSNSQGGI